MQEITGYKIEILLIYVFVINNNIDNLSYFTMTVKWQWQGEVENSAKYVMTDWLYFCKQMQNMTKILNW